MDINKSKPVYIITSCEFTLHEDSWEHGELKLLSCWNEKVHGKASTVEAILNEVPYLEMNLHCFPDNVQPVPKIAAFVNDPCETGDIGRFDACITVKELNGEILKPTAEDEKMWKAGVITLCTLQIIVTVQKLVDINKSDIPACCVNHA